MFRTVDDFLQSWQFEAENTKRLLGTLTDDSLAYGNDHFPRGVRRISEHLSESIPFFMSMIGSPIPDLEAWQAPSTKQQIVDNYDKAVATTKEVAAKLSDEQMSESIPFFGNEAPRGKALAIMIGHQTHHRGQLMVLMREAGLPSTNVYGPTREDWIKMGQEPHL